MKFPNLQHSIVSILAVLIELFIYIEFLIHFVAKLNLYLMHTQRGIRNCKIVLLKITKWMIENQNGTLYSCVKISSF